MVRFFVVVLVSALLAGCSGLQPAQGGELAPATQAGLQATPPVQLPNTGASLDQLFIDMVVPYQQAALLMAESAQSKLQHPEMQAFANNILEVQPEQIDKLQGMRQSWYGSRETPTLDQAPQISRIIQPGGQMKAPQALIDHLDSSSSDRAQSYDLAFIEAMLEHHLILMDAAQVMLYQAEHEEMRAVAQQIWETNSREVERLLAFRTDWLRRPPRPGGLNAGLPVPLGASAAFILQCRVCLLPLENVSSPRLTTGRPTGPR